MNTIVKLFSRAVNEAPNKIALIDKDQSISYSDIDKKSNQLSNYLKSNYNLKKGDRVLFYYHRSIDSIVTLISLLKLGCIYVPIINEFGKSRIEDIKSITGSKIMLTNVNETSGVAVGIETIIYNKAIGEAKHYSNVFSERNISTIDSFCLLFTSGSTGVPKGVLINHKGMVNRILWLIKKQPISENEVCFQNTKFTTVDSIWEIFAPLISGNTLRILDDEIIFDVSKLVKSLHAYQIKRITLVPSLLDSILSSFSSLANILPDMQLWITSGEILSKKLCAKFYEALPLAKLYNQYGLTESCADVSYYDTSSLFVNGKPTEKFYELKTIPIGTPIDNVYFTLKANKAVGSSGELCIYGDCLSPGYFNNEELNNKKFGIITQSSNGKLIRNRALFTGDYVFKNKDGLYELLGRIDDLINIRGFKIYPQEIESIIQGLDFIINCKIVKNLTENKLCLYYTIKQELKIEDEEIILRVHKYCQKQLPHYALPNFFIRLSSFPLTITGKIDINKLPKPDHHHLVKHNLGSHLEPRNETESSLLQIWSVLLGIDGKHISTQDNFFELGGNSLSLVRLASKVQSVFSKSITIRDMYSSPTIAGQALLLQHDLEEGLTQHVHSLSMLSECSSTKPFESPIIPIREGNGEPALFLVHPSGGLSFCYTGLARYIDMPIYGINNPYFTNPEDGPNSIEERATHYIKLIKEIQKTGPYYLGGWSFGGLMALEISHQLSLQKEEVKRLILIDAGIPKKALINPQKNKKEVQEILISSEKDFLLPQELKDLVERNIKARKRVFWYAVPKYRGEVFLLRAERKNKLGKPLKHKINSHGWEGYIQHLKMLDIPGEHFTLFDREYIKSTAAAIKLTLNPLTIEKMIEA